MVNSSSLMMLAYPCSDLLQNCSMLIFSIMLKESLPQTTHNSSSSTPISYDPFLFVDSLTNRSIQVKNFKEKGNRTTHRHSKTQQIQELTASNELDQCIDFLKQTMTFRKKALRQTLFKDSSRRESSSPVQNLARKKRLIRKVISEQIEAESRKQLRKYLTTPNYGLDPNLMRIAKSQNFDINRQAIRKIVYSLEKKEQLQASSQKKELDEADHHFLLRMTTVEREISSEVREKLRKSGEYLVEPRRRFIQAKPHGSLRLEEIGQQLLEKREAVQRLNWLELRGSSKEDLRARDKMRKCTAKMPNKYEAELLDIVASKDVLDVEIFAEKHKKDSLRVKDSKGNSLLHLAVLHNKTPTFEWLLRKLGVTSLLGKNEEGLTPAEMAFHLQRRQILAFIPQSMF